VSDGVKVAGDEAGADAGDVVFALLSAGVNW